VPVSRLMAETRKKKKKNQQCYFFLFFFFFSLGCVTSSQSTAGTKLALIYGTIIRLGFTSFPLLSLSPVSSPIFLFFLFWDEREKTPKINKLWLISVDRL
jgi:hypothetical protein